MKGFTRWERYLEDIGALEVLELRCRAHVAAGFAHAGWFSWKLSENGIKEIGAGVGRSLSLFLQAEATTRAPAAGVPLPPVTLHILMEGAGGQQPEEGGSVTLLGGGRSVSESAERTSKKVFRFRVEDLGTSDARQKYVTFRFVYPRGRVPKRFWSFLRTELDFQVRLLPSKFLEPSVRDLSSPESKLLNRRILISRFLRRFLQYFRQGDGHKLHPSRFLVFFLEPRVQASRSSAHVRSGLFGYSYVLDAEQRRYLELLSEISEAETANLVGAMAREYVPFPFGLCGETYLTARSQDPQITNRLIDEYHSRMPGLAELERRILKESTLVELPVFSGKDAAVDGPDLIIAISLPASAEDGYAGSEGPRSEATARRISELMRRPVGSSFESGELQVMFEFVRRLAFSVQFKA